MKLSSHFRRAAVLGLSLLLAAQLGVGACAASAFDAAYTTLKPTRTLRPPAAPTRPPCSGITFPAARRRAASPRPGGRPVIA